MAERLMHRDILDINSAHLFRYRYAKYHMRVTDNVMDYGCGCGYGTWMLAPYCKAIIGVDNSEEAHVFAKRYYIRNNMDFIISDSPVSSNLFDTIVAFEVVEHVKDSLKLMREFYQYLKPGGKLVMSVPNQNVIPFEGFGVGRSQFHYRHFTPWDLDKLLTNSGFTTYQRHYQISKVAPTVMHGEWIGYTSIVSATK